MGEEIGLKELALASDKLVNAAQAVAPGEPGVRFVSELRGLIGDIRGAVIAGKELFEAKKVLHPAAQQATAQHVETAPRIPSARPPAIKSEMLLTLLFGFAEKYFKDNPQAAEKKLGELLTELKQNPQLAISAITMVYYGCYNQFLDLSTA